MVWNVSETVRSFTDSLAWNLFLISSGCLVFIFGFNGIAVHHDFVPGASYGLSVVAHKMMPLLSISSWYLLLTIPVFIVAWRWVSLRFFLLNLYATIFFALITRYIHLDFGIQNEMYAAIASGVIMGAGCGIILRSYGGGGGLDVVAVILNRKFGIRIGAFYFVVNAAVMGFALGVFTPDKIIASLVMQFTAAVATESTLSMFNQRKAVRIMSKYADELAMTLINGKHHAVLYPGKKGGCCGDTMDMILSITDNIRLRSLEQLVFEYDPEAVMVVENTFSVLGGAFSKCKQY